MKRIVLATVAITCGAVGAVPLAARGAGAAPVGCNASDSAIYTPPAALSGSPGELIACEAVTLSQVPGNVPMRAWKVQYESTNVHGQPVAVSGTVAIPTAPWTGPGSRPVAAFNPGTLGLGPQCAFSKQLAGAYQDEYEGDQISALLKAGYAVAATDGVGYLNGQTHTYMVGTNAGHALLDGVRAAFQIPGGGLSPATDVGIDGYSEGGQASLWAAQLAASYAPGLHVVGAAAGGVPGDLEVVANSLNGGAFAGFLTDAVIGLSTAYPDMPFTSLLNSSGQSAVAQAKTLCVAGTLAAFAGANISNYSTDHLTLAQIYALTGPEGTWGHLIEAQTLGVNIGGPASGAAYKISFPVLQYRGLADEIIPTQTEDATRQAYCDAGIATQWNTYPGDHLLTDNQAITDVVTWLGQRFAGLPTTGNC